jgi:hypothetical protein
MKRVPGECLSETHKLKVLEKAGVRSHSPGNNQGEKSSEKNNPEDAICVVLLKMTLL